MIKRVPAELRQEAFEILHAAGWTVHRVAILLGAAPRTVEAWRIARELPRNDRPQKKIDPQIARQMVADGAFDTAIAERFNVLPSSVVHWRERQGLRSNRDRRLPLTDAQKRQARKMLRLGATMEQVAAEISASRGTVQEIRNTMSKDGLRPTGYTNRTIRARVINDPTIMRRIEEAVGHGVPADVRQEAALSLYTEVLGGRISSALIERQAPHFRNQAWSMCGSKFGDRSLDEEIGEDGWTLMDSIEDPSALEALEAAAEAVWNDN